MLTRRIPRGEEVDDATAAYVLQTVAAAAQLNLTRVVAPERATQTPDEITVVSEYVEAEFVRELQRYATIKRLPIPVGVALRIGLDALIALRGVRDHWRKTGLADTGNTPMFGGIGPYTLAVTRDGITMLTDPFVAAALSLIVGFDENPGLVAYYAPEQLEADPDERSDVFVLGILLWEMIANRSLFNTPSLFRAKGPARNPLEPWPSVWVVADKVADVLIEPLDVASRTSVPTPERVVALIEKALAADPAKRHQTYDELIADIESIGDIVAPRSSVADVVERLASAELGSRMLSSVRSDVPKTSGSRAAPKIIHTLPTPPGGHGIAPQQIVHVDINEDSDDVGDRVTLTHNIPVGEIMAESDSAEAKRAAIAAAANDLPAPKREAASPAAAKKPASQSPTARPKKVQPLKATQRMGAVKQPSAPAHAESRTPPEKTARADPLASTQLVERRPEKKAQKLASTQPLGPSDAPIPRQKLQRTLPLATALQNAAGGGEHTPGAAPGKSASSSPKTPTGAEAKTPSTSPTARPGTQSSAPRPEKGDSSRTPSPPPTPASNPATASSGLPPSPTPSPPVEPVASPAPQPAARASTAAPATPATPAAPAAPAAPRRRFHAKTIIAWALGAAVLFFWGSIILRKKPDKPKVRMPEAVISTKAPVSSPRTTSPPRTAVKDAAAAPATRRRPELLPRERAGENPEGFVLRNDAGEWYDWRTGLWREGDPDAGLDGGDATAPRARP